jgi:hypothetical protein
MLNVHVRVNDGATNKPTPVRLRITDAAGVYRPPLGRLAEFGTAPGVEVGDQIRLGGENHAFIDGACEVPLPSGLVTVQISKGPEYRPLRETVRLAAGQMALRFTIHRLADLRADGWFAGDIRAHDLTPHSALLEGAAEGLAVVQLLVRELPGSMRNVSAFSGTAPALASPECLVVVNTLNVHSVLGRVALLHCHRPVFPLSSGPPGLADWSVADWCDQCHRKKGLVVWSGAGENDGEALASLILGKIDAFEITAFADEIDRYHRLLACAYRPTLVGASGKDSNLVSLGRVRTYARLADGAEFSTGTWIEAVRAGRTFVTSGPLLSLRVAGQDPGSVVSVEKGHPVAIRAEVRSGTPFGALEIVAGGEVVAATTSGELEVEVRPDRSTWIAARCPGLAHTSPVWVEVPGHPIRPTHEAVGPLLVRLDEALGYVAGAGCPSEKHREHYSSVLRSARDALLARTPGGASC